MPKPATECEKWVGSGLRRVEHDELDNWSLDDAEWRLNCSYSDEAVSAWVKVDDAPERSFSWRGDFALDENHVALLQRSRRYLPLETKLKNAEVFRRPSAPEMLRQLSH